MNVLFTLLLRLLAGSNDDAFVEQPLSDGVHLSTLQVASAPKQTFFAFLPLGLALDDAGRAQWSHLLEHMLIRATDAEGLADGAIVFNGETSDGVVRLDVHAPPAEAGRAAAKLCTWLSARDFDEEPLAREKKNVASEVANTAARGATHKWATAAWAQVVRHGAKEAHVLGDVEAATVDELADYAAAKLDSRARPIRIVAVGPLAPAAVKELFATRLASGAGLDSLAGALGTPKPAAKPAAPAVDRALAKGDLAATWDLPATHFLEWYLLPNSTPADRASATLLATLLVMKLQADPELAKSKVVALASADVELPQGRVLFLTASLPDATAKELAAKAFRRAIDTLDQAPPGGSLDAFLAMAANELAGLPDFAALRKQWQGRPGADLLEAQLLLGLTAREWSTGLSFAELGAATRTLTAKELLARRDRALDAKLASRLLLAPRR